MKVLLSVTLPVALCLGLRATEAIRHYNVVWDSPSKLASGQMPLGNGDIAAGVYAIEEGDLFLLLAKNDAYTYNGDIFKTGRVRISLDPNPFIAGSHFRQTLDLPTGSILIEAGDVTVRIWADANRAIYHVRIDAPRELGIRVQPDLWTRFDDTPFNTTRAPIDPPTQDVRADRNNALIWYYHVGDRSVYPAELAYYQVEHMAEVFPDPYRFNTFGNLVESPELTLQHGVLLGRGASADIRIHALCRQTPGPADWVAAIEAQAASAVETDRAWDAHCEWWRTFWNRSWIIASDNTVPAEMRSTLSGEPTDGRRLDVDTGALAAQSYNVFRFLMACQSRGRVQTKFNGGLFTQPLHLRNPQRRRNPTKLEDGTWLSHEDGRLWGRRFTFQNQRLLYWPMLMAGDTATMHPFFRYYIDLLPMRTAITKAWFGHEGAYYRENIEPTGGERDCGRSGKPPKVPPGGNKGQGYYHSFYFTSGLEITAMMIEYVAYTGDTAFRNNVLVPFARQVLLFFDKHYERDENGKLRIDPGMVLETWWIAVNPAPDVAGLQYCLDELLAMGAGSATDQAEWRRFRAELPPIHLREIDGRQLIAPALSWAKKHNAENGELYPVFPFQCFGVALGTEDIVSRTMRHRSNKDRFDHKCWTQDQIHWAYAGNAVEARDGLINRYRHATTACRFPLYGSAGPDSCPDFDHFGSGSTALQRMLLQEGNGKIHLLPAWPDAWDVDFKLHLRNQTIVKGTVKDGKLLRWSITPESRRGDVIVHEAQRVPPPRIIPPNDHPVRIGLDQHGHNRFAGELGRLSIVKGILTADVVSALAAGDRTRPVPLPDVLTTALAPTAGDELELPVGALDHEFTVEAWIRTSRSEQGRILDKVTPGRDNGLLIDCWPGNSLRVLAGNRKTTCDAVFADGGWHHIAITVALVKTGVYIDGEEMD